MSWRWRLVMAGVVALVPLAADAAFLLRQSVRAPLPLQTITDIPLPGGATRFDYQSLDPLTHRLYIAHLGAGMVTVVDVQSNQVVANLAGIAGVHGVLAIPALGRVYASATDAQQVVVIDEQSLHVVARIPAGMYPDGLAYVAPRHEVFVSDEAGGSDLVIDTQSNQLVATIPLGGEAGNTQYDPLSGRIYVDVQTQNVLAAIDPATHALYLPLQEVNGRPVLRIDRFQPLSQRHS